MIIVLVKRVVHGIRLKTLGIGKLSDEIVNEIHSYDEISSQYKEMVNAIYYCVMHENDE